MEDTKTIELYIDSNKYSDEQVIGKLEESVKEFSKKDVKVTVDINEFGVYVIRLEYIDRDTYINKIKYRLKLNRKQRILRKYKEEFFMSKTFDTSNQIISVPAYEERKYGVYKQTRTYRPY